MKKIKTTALIILDGWGNGKDYPGNAIKLAETPTWDSLLAKCKHRELIAGGEAVGLPNGQMGNSEVGHTVIGAGRVIHQTLQRINKSISDASSSESLDKNQALNKFLAAIKKDQESGGSSVPRLHLMGLLSDGGVHSHQEHIRAILALAVERRVKNIMLHLFLDGRDTAPKSAPKYIDYIQRETKAIGEGQIASVSGRYYAMDRDKRWRRTKRTYDAMMLDPEQMGDEIPLVDDPLKQVEEYHRKGITDEFVPPFICRGAAKILARGESFVRQNDYVISINFRADRMRQITKALAADELEGFERSFILPKDSLLTMTDYDPNLPLPYIFGKKKIINCLGEFLADQGLRQLRMAETEKFAHVTYFFNGGREEPFANEERKLIPSLKVATYDLAPEMRAPEITRSLTSAIKSGEYDFILCNYANGDMVGHSGKLDAAIKTVQVVDESLAEIVSALDSAGAQALITADHGNCEEMLAGDPPSPHTAHTLNPVPLLYYGSHRVIFDEKEGGLADIAPTIIKLMGLDAPQEMSGRTILSIQDG